MKHRKLLSIFTLLLAATAAGEVSTSELTLQALEAYRKGNCREAIPLLETLVARQAGNRSARQLLAICRNGGPEAAKSPSAKRAPVSLNAPPEVAEKAAESKEAQERRAAGPDFERAEVAIKQGKLDDAQRLLQAVVKRSPTLMLPRQRLAEVFTRRKQPGLAAETYASMAEVRPDPEYLLRAAQNYSWDKNYQESIRFYDFYLGVAPADREASLARANVMLWARNFDGAAEAFRSHVEKSPEDIPAHAGLANALLWSEDYDGALEQFQWLMERSPKEAVYTLGAAQATENLGDLAGAQRLYQDVLGVQPANAAALEGKERTRLLALERAGYAESEKGNYPKAASLFQQVLEAKPSDQEAILALARVHAWGERYSDSAAQYRRYLKLHPNDDDALRELARVELAVPDFPAAQQHFEQLSTRPQAKREDLEGLINSLVWAGKPAAAEPWAKKLAAMDAANTSALDALRILGQQRATTSRENAQKLTGEGRYPEAIEAYRAHQQQFGPDRESMLAIARIYSWDKQLPRSIVAYQEYLARYPNDTVATVELGRVQQYSGNPGEAESVFRSVLAKEKDNAQALLGMAQVADEAGQDPFRVVEAYRTALRADKSLKRAQDRLEDLIPETSPSAGFQMKHFGDSDGFRRDVYSLEGSVPLRGGLRLTPFYRYIDSAQLRQVGGAECSAEPGALTGLSDEICATNGAVHGHSGGMRLSLAPVRWLSLSASASQTRFSLDQSRFNAEFEVTVRPATDTAFTLGFTRRDAFYDVNTIGSLFAGVMGDSYYAAYSQPLSNRWRLSLLGGVTRFDEGRGGYSVNTVQRRGMARVLYRIGSSANAGYYMRVSSFTRPTELFFSPSLYGVAGATYDWNKRLSERLTLLGEAELGFGRLRRFNQIGVNVTEFALYAGIGWRVRPDLNLRIGYRLSRGVSSSFGSPVYRTGAFDFGMTDYFAPLMQTTSPSRIEIQ